DSKSSVQTDVNAISEKLQKLFDLLQRKSRVTGIHTCLYLFQYFEILIYCQRVGLDDSYYLNQLTILYSTFLFFNCLKYCNFGEFIKDN
ncbi:hypothetical protein TTHERM_001006600, partial (macronuclear) [Tetrahymena thermophila SB210]